MYFFGFVLFFVKSSGPNGYREEGNALPLFKISYDVGWIRF